jgi:hypothetical protein
LNLKFVVLYISFDLSNVVSEGQNAFSVFESVLEISIFNIECKGDGAQTVEHFSKLGALFSIGLSNKTLMFAKPKLIISATHKIGNHCISDSMNDHKAQEQQNMNVFLLIPV